MFKNWAVSPGSMCFGEDYDIPKKAMTFPKKYIPGNCPVSRAKAEDGHHFLDSLAVNPH